MGGRARGRRPLLVLALAILLLAIPWLLPQRYFLRVVDLGLIYAVLALGLQLLVGSAGQLSLGHAAFYGTGAYTSAILARKLGVPVEAAFLAGAVVAALLALTLVPVLRLRGNELAVATLGFGVIVHSVILNEEWLTEGPFGMMKIPPFRLGPLVFDTEFRFYYFGLAVTAATYLAFRRLMRSRFGRALEAIRQSEEAAVTSGINPVRYKSKVFVIAAFTAGLAGGLFAHLNRYLNPNDFTLTESINILIMVVVGGLRSLEGAIAGAMIIVFASEYLRAFKEYRLILFGALLVVFMALGADGLRGLPSKLAAAARRRTRSAARRPAPEPSDG
jgi:branched-chain amino acid transport system permease protein